GPTPPALPIVPYTPLFRSARTAGGSDPQHVDVSKNGEHDRPARVLAERRGVDGREHRDPVADLDVAAHPHLLVGRHRDRDPALAARKSTRQNSSHVPIAYA